MCTNRDLYKMTLASPHSKSWGGGQLGRYVICSTYYVPQAVTILKSALKNLRAWLWAFVDIAWLGDLRQQGIWRLQHPQQGLGGGHVVHVGELQGPFIYYVRTFYSIFDPFRHFWSPLKLASDSKERTQLYLLFCFYFLARNQCTSDSLGFLLCWREIP